MKIIIGCILISLTLLSQDKIKTDIEKEAEVIDYTNIQSVLKEDGLEKEAVIKEKIVKKVIQKKKEIQYQKYNYPQEKDFWSFVSELWLVKNAQDLNWDSQRPEYGINIAFKNLLEKLGYYNYTYKILIVDTPNIAHIGLPSNPNSMTLVLSLPFMRTLDLTKVDISLLLLENFIRIKSGYFVENLIVKKDFVGKNFYNEGINLSNITNLLNDYSNVVYKKGFNFQQQYETTKQMDRLLKSYPALWSSYLRLLTKIDRLIKTNLLFKTYTKIYPSPEMQLQWLKPKEATP